MIADFEEDNILKIVKELVTEDLSFSIFRASDTGQQCVSIHLSKNLELRIFLKTEKWPEGVRLERKNELE
jgi:hypothetical protein